MLDEVYPRGALNYWKSTFLNELSDAAIDAMAERFAVCPSPATAMIVEHFHGEVTRVPVDATAIPHREPGYNAVITSVWMDPATTEENVAWTRETYDALQPFAASRRWLNYLPADEADDAALDAAFGANRARLVELKTTYDPTNLFRLNANIKPD